MTHILHRSIGHDYPIAVSGDGIFIRDGIIIVTSGTKVPDGFVF